MGRHLRSNLVAYVALFFALSGGTASAVSIARAPRNSVDSAAIVNGQVKRADVGANAINSSKVANGTLRRADFAPGTLLRGPAGPPGPAGPGGGTGGGAPSGPAGGDLAGTYPNPTVGPNAIASAEVADNSLTGADVDESRLGQVPSALLGGLGRRSAPADCNPSAPAFVPCAAVNLVLLQKTHVLVLGTVDATATKDVGVGFCRLRTSAGGALPGTAEFRILRGGFNGGTTNHATLLAVTPPVGPGTVSFGVECNEDSNRPDAGIRYLDATVAALGISPS